MVDCCLYIVHLWADSRIGWEGGRKEGKEGGREGGREGETEGGRGVRNGLRAEGGRYAYTYRNEGGREGYLLTSSNVQHCYISISTIHTLVFPEI